MTGSAVATQLIEHAGAILLATGAVGTAASALVDASRGILPSGGVSACGYKHIRAVYDALEPALSVALGRSWEPVLRGYWLNGTPHEQQINTVIALVRLGLNDDNPQALLDRLLNSGAPDVRLASSSDASAAAPVEMASLKDAVRLIRNPPVPPSLEDDGPVALEAVAPEVTRAEALRTQQAFDALGRFDALVRARLEAAFELADHDYRAKARLSAAVVSLLLALACGAAFAYADGSVDDTVVFAGAAILGLLAVPLAPIAKDLTSALRAASDALKTVTNKG